MKKKLSLLLILALLLTCVALFASCGENGGNTTDTSKRVEDQTEDPYLDDLPLTMNFDNQEICFVMGEPSMGHGGTFSERSIGLSNYVLGTNAVDDAVYKRNQKIEERLKVVISPTHVDDAVSTSAVYADLQSGASEFDVISTYECHDNPMALQGIVLDLFNLGDDADYLNLKAEYWSQAYTAAGIYNGSSYWATGDLALRYIGGAYCTFVNTQLYSDAIEGGDDGNGGKFGSIYDIVKAGKWTLETLNTMGTMVFQDTGTSVGKADTSGDILGLVLEAYDVTSGFFNGCNFVIISRDPANNPMIALDPSDEHVINAITNLNKVLYKSNYFTFATFEHSKNSMTYFAQGNALFTNDKMYQSELYLGNMEAYGIIPTPKSDEAQANYCTTIHNGCNTFGIYTGSDNVPAVAATLEAMAALSLQTVTPQYYDMALKYRYTRDEDSAAMIDLIRSCVYVDFTQYWTNTGISTGISDSIQKGTMSNIKSYESTWENALEKFLGELDELQEATK